MSINQSLISRHLRHAEGRGRRGQVRVVAVVLRGVRDISAAGGAGEAGARARRGGLGGLGAVGEIPSGAPSGDLLFHPSEVDREVPKSFILLSQKLRTYIKYTYHIIYIII